MYRMATEIIESSYSSGWRFRLGYGWLRRERQCMENATRRGARAEGSKPRLAIVMHGRLGDVESLQLGARPKPLRAFENAHSSARLAVLCAISGVAIPLHSSA